MCVCKCPPVSVVNAFSQMLRGNMFSTFAAGKSTNFEACILHLRLQFNSDCVCVCVCMIIRAARVMNAFPCALRGNVFSTLSICKSINLSKFITICILTVQFAYA